MIPHWAILGLSAAILSTAIPLIQERMKADGFAVAFWVKVAAVLLSAPFVVHFGFRMIQNSMAFWPSRRCCGAYQMSSISGPCLSQERELSRGFYHQPSSFPLFSGFFVDPGLLKKYVDNPLQSVAIMSIIILATLFATRIRKCALSWQGVRLVWFVIFAACVGPIIEKVSLGYAPSRQAPYAFIFCQGLMMLGFWALYYYVRKPIPTRTLFSRQSILTGAAIGSVATLVIYLKTTALVSVDQPAFLSVLLYTDALWILLVYRLLGRRDDSNIWAGLGIVGCAGALILVKSLF